MLTHMCDLGLELPVTNSCFYQMIQTSLKVHLFECCLEHHQSLQKMSCKNTGMTFIVT